MEDIVNADLLVEVGYSSSACKLNNATNKHLALSNIFSILTILLLLLLLLLLFSVNVILIFNKNYY